MSSHGNKEKKQGDGVNKGKKECVIWESNPGLPDVTRMATENFTTKPITPLWCCVMAGSELLPMSSMVPCEDKTRPPPSSTTLSFSKDN